MPDINIERQTYIWVSDNDFTLFPATNLYPSTELFPNSGQLIDTIVSGTMKLDEMLYDNSFKFGTMCSDKFEVTVYDVDDLSGKYIYVYQIDNGVYTSLFSGIIESSKLDRVGTDRQVIAYDLAYWYRDIDVGNWWTTFWNNKGYQTNHNVTATIKELRESLCAYICKEERYIQERYEIVTLPNDSISVTKNLDISSISFGDMISVICELNCCFPHFSREGKLEFIIFNVEDTAYNVDDNLEGENCSFEDYITIPMEGVIFYDSSNNVKLSIGDSDNAYVVSKNFLLYNSNTTTLNSVANVLLDYLADFEFTPSKLKLIISDYDILLGTYIETEHGNCYANKISYSGGMLVEETITASGKQNMGDSMATVNLESIITAERYHTLIGDIEQFKSEVGQYETLTDGTLSSHYSLIQQNATSITTEVSRATGAEGTLSSRITQNADQIVMKVAANNRMVTCALSASASSGSTFEVKADNLDLSANDVFNIMSGGTLNLTSKNIAISSNNFSVNSSGNLSCSNASISGAITATSGTFNGTVNASGGTFSGNITASGTISGGTISGATISGGDISGADISGGYIYGSTYYSFNPSGGVCVSISSSGIHADTTAEITETSALPGVEIHGNHTGNLFFPYLYCNIASSSTTPNLRVAGIMTSGETPTYAYGGLHHIFTSSSKRYKHDIKNLEDDWINAQRLYDLPVRQFIVNNDILKKDDCRYGKILPGFIAEEVEEIYPAAADYDENNEIVETWSERYIIPPMLKLIQEQHEEIETLKDTVATLTARLEKLEEVISC